MAPTWGSKRRSPRPLPAVVSLFGDDAAADAMPAGQPVRKLREEDAAASQECPTARAHNTGRQPPQASAQHRAAATTIDSGSLHSPFADNLPAPAPGHVPHKLLAPLEPYSCTYWPFTTCADADHGDASMLVDAGEQSHALTGDAPPAASSAARHAPDAIMEAATADRQAPGPVLDAPSADASFAMAGALPILDPAPVLDPPLALSAMDPDPVLVNGGLNGYGAAAPAEQRLSAFARLRFDDGSYYMHTYQIILGRNVQLAHKDMRRLAKVEQLQAKGEQQRAHALLHGRRRKRGGARSVISEAGGIVNAPIEMMPMEYQQRRQSVASQSHSSGSHQPGEASQDIEHAPQEVLMQAFPEAPDQIDRHVPEDPNDCPLVPIHPQHITDRTGLRGPKGISRQHAKIFYDFENGHFCLEVLGSNGLYHEETFLSKGQCVDLSHGDTITIGMVEMTFFLPDIALTEEERNRQESGSQSRPMSFSFENGRGESEDMDDSASEDMSVNPRHVYHVPVGSDFESEEDAINDEDDDDEEDFDDLEDDDRYSPVPRPKQSLKLKLKTKRHEPQPKPSKSSNKRKAARESSPEEPPAKKAKPKPVKELPKEKGKAAKIPAKMPSKTPAKQPKEPTPKHVNPPKEKVEPAKTVKPGSPVAVRKSEKVEGDEGEVDGIITAEVARQYNLPESLIGTPLQKRKGPGRPPKDGVMSKRQRSQLIKQGKEIEKARAAGIDPADLPQPTMKPKIARRKESNAGDDDDIRETTEKGEGIGAAGEKKQTKPAKPARTPSPEMRIEDYTEEQLQRPTANYVVLIHEAISSAATGQMNLQQIYNYIERNYPWYKFKTTTSGWQSSVRHNLGQHDAFVKGDKEGKGYMWKINPNVSIEKERRKRQVSPPQVNHAQRQGYYPPPNNFSPYAQPGFYQGVPSNGAPRPPAGVEPVQPRLPPSMARNSTSDTAPRGPAAPAPSPYASPWAGGNSAGSPSSQHPPRPYPPPNSQTPPGGPAGPSSGQYGVLYPTTAPQAPSSSYATSGTYGGTHTTAGQSPYPTTPGGRYTPYPSPALPTAPATGSASTPGSQAQHPAAQHETSGIPHPSGRYPASTNPDLIRQLEAFRQVYLATRIEPGEDKKVDNAIKAYVTPSLGATLTPQEQNLLTAIKSIPLLEQYRGRPEPVKEEGAPASSITTPANGERKEAAPTAAVAAIAADAAANTVPTSQPSTATSPTEPLKPTPNATAPIPASAPVPASVRVQTQRPSVEPLTPVPGSPAVQSGTPIKRSFPERTAPAPEEVGTRAQESAETEGEPAKEGDPVPKVEST